MKKKMLIACVLMMVTATAKTLVAGDSLSVEHVVAMQDISEEMIGKIMRGERQDIALACVEGSVIPLRAFVKGDLIHLDTEGYNDLALRVERTFFLKSDGEEILFSLDCQEWKTIFEFATGNLMFSLFVEGDQVVAEIGMECNAR